MENTDTQDQTEYDDETVFLSDVIQEEHELLFLDSYLREAFRGRVVSGAGDPKGGSGSATFGEESTL